MVRTPDDGPHYCHAESLSGVARFAGGADCDKTIGFDPAGIFGKLAGGATTGDASTQNHQPRKGRWIKGNVRQILRHCDVAIPNIPRETSAFDDAPLVVRCNDEPLRVAKH
jgi:hypothetical protein